MKLIYCVLFLCLAGIWGFLNHTPGQQPFQLSASKLPSPLNDVDYLYYGRRYRLLPSLEKSDINHSVVKPATSPVHTKAFSKKELKKFKGLLDLSNDSFTYRLVQMRPLEVDQLMCAGLILIQFHPKLAKRYAHRLLECHLLQNHNPVDEETFPDEAVRATHTPVTSLNKGFDHVNDIAATLSVSALSFYSWFSWIKLFDFIWFVLKILYYTTTIVGCLLVAFFIGERLVDHPSIKPDNPSSASWPPASVEFPSIVTNAPGKTYPHAIPL